LIDQHAWFSHYGLTAFFTVSDRRSDFRIQVPEEHKACELYFNELGYEARMSPNGKYASAFTNLIGGIANVRNLARLPVFRVLDVLAIKSTKKVAQRIIKQLPAGAIVEEELVRLLSDVDVIPEWKTKANTLETLKNEAKLEKQELFQVLTQLAEMKILRRGVFVSCNQCGVPAWHPIASVTEQIECAGCGHRDILPIEFKKGSGIEMQWQYTLNSLANRVMDQDALPHLLALSYLTTEGNCFALQPGVELARKGNDNVEIEFDFLFVKKQRLHGGECKSGSRLTEKDFATARRAREFGFEEFSFCTIREFEQETREQIDSLANEMKSQPNPMLIRVLSGKEILGARFT
jgi:hypothetical protein